MHRSFAAARVEEVILLQLTEIGAIENWRSVGAVPLIPVFLVNQWSRESHDRPVKQIVKKEVARMASVFL